MFYAAHNTRADLQNGNHGFLNTWEISRFKTNAERKSFIKEYENQGAKPVSRKEAKNIFDGTFLCVGEKVPVGGLFSSDNNFFWWEK